VTGEPVDETRMRRAEQISIWDAMTLTKRAVQGR
jgi:hypothetical protein